MAIDGYMAFKYYPDKKVGGKDFLESESLVDWKDNSGLGKESNFIDLGKAASAGSLFEVEDWSFGVERTLSTSSQSSGIGTGTATFEPFSITRKIDKASPLLFQMSCSGATFQRVTLALRKGGGDGSSGMTFLRYDFKLVGVKSMSWSHGDEAPTETVTFEYGAVAMRYTPQDVNGTMLPVVPGGWNRILNRQDTEVTDIAMR